MTSFRISMLAALLSLFVASIATAEPMSVYGTSDGPDRLRGPGGMFLRAGVGSLFGPAFDAGQPDVAQADGEGWQNRRPFDTTRQTLMTGGLAGSMQWALGRRWGFGLTLAAGYNATRTFEGASTQRMLVDDQLTGFSIGGGPRLTYGAGPVRLTLDALATESRMRGTTDWSYDAGALAGSGEYSYGLTRVAILAGLETDFGPLFLFGNAGAQYLPEQTRDHNIVGLFPYAAGAAGALPLVARKSNRGTGSVTFAEEFSLAATVGFGIRI